MEPISKYPKPLEISELPELARIAEEVRATQEPRLLRQNGKPLALLTPLPPAKRMRKSKADYAAFLASAGSWKGLVDVDRVLEENAEARRRSVRPSVQL